jgi:hypothetical protein
MDAFSPEFTAYWLAEPAESLGHESDGGSNDSSTLSTSQQVALEELAERVNAARRVV